MFETARRVGWFAAFWLLTVVGCSTPIFRESSCADAGSCALPDAQTDGVDASWTGPTNDSATRVEGADASEDGDSGASAIDPQNPDSGEAGVGLDGPDAAPAMCLIDFDGDGFGVEGICPAAGQKPGVQPRDCDDRDEAVYPGAPIVRCDGVDNDCQGGDEEKVEESCNGADDDCDGMVDQQLVEPVSARVVTREGTAASKVDIALVSRPDGGAFLLSLPQIDGSSAENIRFAGIGPDGRFAVDPTQHGVLPKPATEFVADSDGRWLAVLSVERPKADDSILRLQLFRASDLTRTSEIEIVYHEDDDGTAGDRNDGDDCDNVESLDVAVFTAGDGQVWVAMQFVDYVGKAAQSGCSPWSTSVLQVASFSPAGVTPALHARTDLRSGANIGQVAKIPCRSEWLVLDRERPLRFSLQGNLLDDTYEPIPGVGAVWSLVAEPGHCDEPVHKMAAAYMAPKTLAYSPTFVRFMHINASDGSLARLGNDVEMTGDMGEGAALQTSLGRWFLAGWFSYPSTRPRLWEVAPSDAVVPKREVLLPDGGALPGYGGNTVAVIATPNAPLVSYQNAYNSTLANFRESGDTASPTAVLYRLGCE